MRAKVSVIVPIYGVEKFIERNVRSLFEQTLDDMEFIFVNDCTEDNSIGVLKTVMEEYPLRKEQTRIINHPFNKGLPAARYSGLVESKGEYIAHCDSDDWVDRDLYKTLYEKAVTDNLDMVVCNYIESDGVSFKLVIGESETNSVDYLIRVLNNKAVWSVWSRLTRKELYERGKVLFPVYNMGEDLVLTAQLIFYSKSIGYIDKPYYYYYKNAQSITHESTIDSIVKRTMQCCENVKLLEDCLLSLTTDRRISLGLLHMKQITRDLMITLVGYNEYYTLWRNTFPEINGKILTAPNIPIKNKIKFVLAWCHLYPLRRIQL